MVAGEGASRDRAGKNARPAVRSTLALLSQAGTYARERYFRVDPRTLGLYRIALGALLLIDGLRHWLEARVYYSNNGVLTNHFLLFRPAAEFHFSLFNAFSSAAEVHLAYAFATACYLALCVGYKTRLFCLLSFVWVTSMNSRLVLIENGGYIVVNLMLFYALFLPLGRRFSIDALVASFRRERETGVADLSRRVEPGARSDQVETMAAFLLLLNFVVIYVFNVVNKYGNTWRHGETIHFVLHIDRMVTDVGVFMRELLPYRATVVVNHVVLVVEAMIVVLISWPSHRLWSRPAAMVLIAFLHLSFGVTMLLGPFSWFMVGWSTVLLLPIHWRALREFHARSTPALTLRFRETSGIAFQACRLLKRLDGAERLRFEASAGGPWLAVIGEGAEARSGRPALVTLLRALPAGRVVVPLLRLVSLGLVDLALWVLDRHSDALDRFFGFTRATPGDLPGEGVIEPPAPPSPVAARIRRVAHLLREVVLVYFLLIFVSQLLNENKAIPALLKHNQPVFVRASLLYPRLFQGWGMFAPNPVREDGIVAVDGITIDGRHIDPFTGKEPDLWLSDARSLDMNQVHQDYFNRIRLDHNRPYRKPLREYLERWHIETGHPANALVAFDVWWLTDLNPTPGQSAPTDHQLICIESWRKPGYRPPAGTPALPKPCKIESADKRRGEKDDGEEKDRQF
jgi:hypothetical protein